MRVPAGAGTITCRVMSLSAVGIPSLELRRIRGRMWWRNSAPRIVRSCAANAGLRLLVLLGSIVFQPISTLARWNPARSRAAAVASACCAGTLKLIPSPLLTLLRGRRIEVGPPRLKPLRARAERQLQLLRRVDRVRQGESSASRASPAWGGSAPAHRSRPAVHTRLAARGRRGRSSARDDAPRRRKQTAVR